MIDNENVEQLSVVPVNTLGTLMRAEIDVQIATAKQYPRSISTFKKTALSMATMDEETAASCFYSLPRAGKEITGPSVRLAEIVANAWGNIRWAARIISDDGKMLTAQGVCVDMERNVSGSIEIKRRVTDKTGRRFSEDMVVVTANAACSIAKRQAIFGVVPMAYVKEIEREARKVAIGDAKTLGARRTQALDYFQKMGVREERILLTLERASVEDVNLEDLAKLTGLKTALRDGDTTIDEAFLPAPVAAKPPVGRVNLRNGKERPPAVPPVAAEPAAPAAPIPEPAATELAEGELPPEPGGTSDLADDLMDEIGQAVSRSELALLAMKISKHQQALGQVKYEQVFETYNARYDQLPPRSAKR